MRRLLLTSFLVLSVLAGTTPLRADDKEQKEVKALLEKAIKAAGGAKNLDKYKGMTQKYKGEITIMNTAVEFSGESAIQMPDQIRNEMDLTIMGNAIKVVVVFNKDKGWVNAAGNKMKMDKDTITEAREQLHSATLTLLTPLLDKAYKLSPLGETKIDGKECVGVSVERKGYRDVSLYFDKKTSLLTKLETRALDQAGGGGGEVSKEIFYSDYKDLKGMKHPYKVTIKMDGKDYLKAESTEVKPVEKVDASTFDEPS